MNYLLPGQEPLTRMQLLIDLTKMSSQPQIQALIQHYVNGLPAERAAARHGIELSNFVRAQIRIEAVASIVEQIKEIDWQKLNANIKRAS
ncbi:hypothetical protein ACQKE0_01705 [Shewanella colwelliana]|uniref:hypothetical protein n=1 Tax=Shewanella colwelliana TaxID=23 RepID=UPI003D077A4E